MFPVHKVDNFICEDCICNKMIGNSSTVTVFHGTVITSPGQCSGDAVSDASWRSPAEQTCRQPHLELPQVVRPNTPFIPLHLEAEGLYFSQL
jgi:hypothetical protein